MEWYYPAVVRRHLTMLVIDIRNSSEVFLQGQSVPIEEVVSDLTNSIVMLTQAVTNGVASDVRIDKFTGDGFLVLFDEPDARARVRLGPARALTVARMFRAEFQRLVAQWIGRYADWPNLDRLGVVSGIVRGEVLYGPLNKAFTQEPTVLLEPVVRAFRYAQVRNEPTIQELDFVLTCPASREELLNLRASRPSLDAHPLLSGTVTQAQFRPLNLTDLKGVRSGECFEIVWANVSTP